MSHNAHQVARALAECTVEGDARVAARAGVDRTTIVAWRKRLQTDEELKRLFAGYVLSLDATWRREIEAVATQAARDLQALQEATHRLVMEAVTDPDGLLGPDEEPPSVMERVAMAQEAMREVRLTMEKSAEMLTHYAAIVGEPDRSDGTVEKASPFGPGPGGSPAEPASQTTRH